MARVWALAALGVAIAAAAVAWHVRPPGKPKGYAGLEFAGMTPAAAARAPLLTTRGALVYDVAADGPAAKAGIKPGEVVAAIDHVPIVSAKQASNIVRNHASGDRVTFTLFDEVTGDIHPHRVVVTFADVPPEAKTLTVRPPRTLAKEYFYPPGMVANAAWSRHIARGPTIRPLAVPGLGAGRCNGFAPEKWQVRGHASDDTMLHVAAPAGFQHALFASERLDGRAPQAVVLALIRKTFGSEPVASPRRRRPYGFVLFDFGLPRGATGFAEYRVRKDRIAMWIAAVPAADAAWDLPLAGAVVFSLHCEDAGAPPPRPKPAALPSTSVSTRCIQGACGEGDFAAAYLGGLRYGYVHDKSGSTFLVNPRRDLWLNGADGPGFYRQVGGENEKLDPGRTN